MLNNLSTSDAIDTYLHYRDSLAGGRGAHEFACVYSISRNPDHYLVLFSNHIVNCDMDIGEGGEDDVIGLSHPLNAGWDAGESIMVNKVFGIELVKSINIPFIKDFFPTTA